MPVEGLFVPENIAAAAEITLISFSVTKWQLLPVSVRHLELQREGSVGSGCHVNQ